MDKTTLLTCASQIKRYYYDCFKPYLKRTGLTTNQLDILLFLKNNPKFNTARQITEMRHMTKSHVSASIDSLITLGLVSEKISPTDRRARLLFLTDGATDVVGEALKIQTAVFKSLFKGFSSAELSIVKSLFEKLSRNVTEVTQVGLD